MWDCFNATDCQEIFTNAPTFSPFFHSPFSNTSSFYVNSLTSLLWCVCALSSLYLAAGCLTVELEVWWGQEAQITVCSIWISSPSWCQLVSGFLFYSFLYCYPPNPNWCKQKVPTFKSESPWCFFPTRFYLNSLMWDSWIFLFILCECW